MSFPDGRGPMPHISTRRVMARVILAGALFAGTLIYVSSNQQQLATTGLSRDQIILDVRGATPSRAIAWQKGFVPAAEKQQQQVRRKLASLGQDWQDRGITVSVTPTQPDVNAMRFAEQLDGWLQNEGLAAARGEGADRATSAHGLVIYCHEYQRPEARALLQALAPAMRGRVSIEFSPSMEPGQMAIYIENAPSFNEAGIAYFSAAGTEAA